MLNPVLDRGEAEVLPAVGVAIIPEPGRKLGIVLQFPLPFIGQQFLKPLGDFRVGSLC